MKLQVVSKAGWGLKLDESFMAMLQSQLHSGEDAYKLLDINVKGFKVIFGNSLTLIDNKADISTTDVLIVAKDDDINADFDVVYKKLNDLCSSALEGVSLPNYFTNRHRPIPAIVHTTQTNFS